MNEHIQHDPLICGIHVSATCAACCEKWGWNETTLKNELQEFERVHNLLADGTR